MGFVYVNVFFLIYHSKFGRWVLPSNDLVVRLSSSLETVETSVNFYSLLLLLLHYMVQCCTKVISEFVQILL